MANAKHTRAGNEGTLAIRPAGEDDIAAMANILGDFFGSHASALPSVFAPASHGECVEYFRRNLAKSEEHFFVATVQGDAVGILSLEEVRRDGRLGRQPENHVMIHLLAVNESHRRRGIAVRLMRHAHEWAKTRGFETVLIHVWAFNEAAQKLYEALGYTTLSQVMVVELQKPAAGD